MQYRKKLSIQEYSSNCKHIKNLCSCMKESIKNLEVISQQTITEIQIVRSKMKNCYSVLPKMEKRLMLFIDSCDSVLYKIVLYNDYRSFTDKQELLKAVNLLQSHAITLYKESRKEVLLNEYVNNYIDS